MLLFNDVFITYLLMSPLLCSQAASQCKSLLCPILKMVCLVQLLSFSVVEISTCFAW